MGYKRAAFIMTAALVFGGRAEALTSGVFSAGSISQERGCYCLQPTGKAFQPYQTWAYPTQRFGWCEGTAVPLGEDIFERIMPCDELKTCLQLSEELHCGSKQASEKCAQLDKDCFTRRTIYGNSIFEVKDVQPAKPVSTGDQVKDIEKLRDEAQKKVNQLCRNRRPGPSDSQPCQQARQELSLARRRLDDIKTVSIRLVRSLEEASAAMQRAVNEACAGSHQAVNQEKCQKAKEAFAGSQKVFEKVSDSLKKEIYGCKRWYETPLECANVTLEGAKLTLSDWSNGSSGTKPETGTTGTIENKSLKEKILSAKQDALSGHLKDCQKKGNQFTCMVIAPSGGQARLEVDYTTYKGWELAQPFTAKFQKAGDWKRKWDPETQAWDDSDSTAAKKEPKKEKKAEGVAGMVEGVRAGFELANRLKDDLRNTEKWPSKKLNPSDVKNYDPNLRAKYDEQMKLSNALKREPMADPAALAQRLNLKSDPLKELGVPPLAVAGQAKEEGAPSDKSRLMSVVDQDGRSADKKIGNCQRSYGFVVVMSKSGVSYCQQVPKAAKTLARIKDSSSVTGFKIVRQCPAGQPFQNTNWAGPGSGECLAMKSP